MSEANYGRVQRQPTNFNELRNTAFQLKIESKDKLNFFIVAANLPGFELGAVDQMTPVGRVPWSGDHNFEELQVQFIVDEDLVNWLEVHNWMRAAASVAKYDDYDFTEIFRDGVLVLKTNQYSPNVAVNFVGLVPRGLSGLDFDSRTSEPEIITATITFAYTDYTIETI
jgi:hypothetical protein